MVPVLFIFEFQDSTSEHSRVFMFTDGHTHRRIDRHTRTYSHKYIDLIDMVMNQNKNNLGPNTCCSTVPTSKCSIFIIWY